MSLIKTDYSLTIVSFLIATVLFAISIIVIIKKENLRAFTLIMVLSIFFCVIGLGVEPIKYYKVDDKKCVELCKELKLQEERDNVFILSKEEYEIINNSVKK